MATIEKQINLFDHPLDTENSIQVSAFSNYAEESNLSDAVSFSLANLFTYQLSDNEDYYIITGVGETAVPNITIPIANEGLPVKAIGDEAFIGNTTLTSVEIPSNIKSIGLRAFKDCVNLATIIIHDDTTTSKGSNDFELKIGQYAFANTGIINMTIPNTVKALSSHMFDGCRKLDTIYFSADSTLTSIGGNCFEDSTIDNIELPEGVTTIQSYAFRNSALTYILLPNTLVTIGLSAFSGSKLINVEFPDNGTPQLKKIEANSFDKCSALIAFTIPAAVESIGRYAFRGCTELTAKYGVTFKKTDSIWVTSDEYDRETLPYNERISIGILADPFDAASKLVADSGYYWHRIVKLMAPTVSISDHTLTVTDEQGLADGYNLYSNGKLRATIYN